NRPERSRVKRMRRTAALLTLAGLVTAAAPVARGADAPPAHGTAHLEGQILRSDAKTPVENAVVRACYLENGTSVVSPATGPKGAFDLEGLPAGYADMVVETPDGVFV